MRINFPSGYVLGFKNMACYRALSPIMTVRTVESSLGGRLKSLWKRWIDRANQMSVLVTPGYPSPRIESMVDCAPWGFLFKSENPLRRSCRSRFCPWCWCRTILKPQIRRLKAIGWSGALGDYRLLLTTYNHLIRYEDQVLFRSAVEGGPVGSSRGGLQRARLNLRRRGERAGAVGGATLFTVEPHNWGSNVESRHLYPPSVILSVRHFDLLPPGGRDPRVRPLGLAADDRTVRRSAPLRNRRAVAWLLGEWAAYPPGRMFGPVEEVVYFENKMPRHRAAAYGVVKFPGRAAGFAEEGL